LCLSPLTFFKCVRQCWDESSLLNKNTGMESNIVLKKIDLGITGRQFATH
jgi:hypothetical protein